MKKTVFTALLLAALLSGCGSTQPTDTQQTADNGVTESTEPIQENDLPCTFTVPEGWVRSEEYSNALQIIYVAEAQQDVELPDNIAVSVGTHQYDMTDPAAFRDAMLQQATAQRPGSTGEVTAEGATNANGDTLYTFTINSEDSLTVQHYIVRAQDYALVQLTRYTDAEESLQAAQALADSLRWK